MSKDINNEIKKIKEALKEYKKNHSNDNDPNINLIISITDSDVNGVNKAIDQGAYVNYRDKEGYTPLIYAAVYNETAEITYILLSHEADPFQTSVIANLTPLQFAQEMKHLETVAVLKKAMGIPESSNSNLSHENNHA